MAITKERKEKRKPSWESKISVCTASTRPVGKSERSDTPSSILSSDSDIRFTRKLGSQYRCGCCIVAGFLLFLLVASLSVYLAYTFILSRSVDERIFRINFKVTEGDFYEAKLADPSTEDFRIRARNYRERLNLIFRRSSLRPAFLKTEILALDGNEGEDLVVHFNAHFDGRIMAITTEEIEEILTREINLEKSLYLTNLTIPVESLIIWESSADMTTNFSLGETSTSPSTTTRRPPRQCATLQLDYCSKMSYNITSYPNIVGHNNHEEVVEDVISFREIVDVECYRLAYEFVCLVLQPPCQKGAPGEEDSMVMPCRSFCNEFVKNCGQRIPSRFKNHLDCSKFDEFSGSGICVPKPGCVEELQAQGLDSRICDGVVDCPDMSDELSCSYCDGEHLHCGVGKFCVPPEKKCDGIVDCPNGSDEKNCLSVLPSSKSKNSVRTIHPHRYFESGFVAYNSKGQLSKLCMDNFNITQQDEEIEEVRELADSLCQSASYLKSAGHRIEEDGETDYLSYVQVEEENRFEATDCPSKKIIRVNCEDLQCGIQVLHSKPGVQGLNKLASHGDWPWHVVLFKDSVHMCDGTLLSRDWVLTTASCFQGQSKAVWVARLGSIRLSGSSPWEQERQVVGMMKSPVEGSTLVLIKLNEPAIFSDFVRPVCFSEMETHSHNYTYCTTLGWNKNRGQLQRIDVKINQMTVCENVSIATASSVCAESLYMERDCDEEEFSGSPLLCLPPEGKQWHLIGVSNWRIACQKIGTERPRLYNKILTNLKWINQTISNS